MGGQDSDSASMPELSSGSFDDDYDLDSEPAASEDNMPSLSVLSGSDDSDDGIDYVMVH